MKWINYFVLSTLPLCMSASFAADFYFCIQTNNYVHLGDALEQAKQACGKPLASDTKEVSPHATREVERWTYDNEPNAALRTGKEKQVYGQNLLVVDFVDNKVIKITVKGQSVKQTHFCGPFLPIKLGDSGPVVYQICQYPTTKNTLMVPISDKPIQQTTLTYSDDSLGHTTKLIFQSNKLMSIE